MKNYRNRHPWMTDVLRTLIKEKHTLNSKFKVTNNRQTFHDYNIKKNLLKSAQRNAEIKYFSDQLDLHKDKLLLTARTLLLSEKFTSTKTPLSYVDSISNTIVNFNVSCVEAEHAISTLKKLVQDGMQYQPLRLRNALLALLNR